MTTPLPEAPVPEELAIRWKRNRRETKIVLLMSGVELTIKAKHSAVDLVPIMVQALPEALNQAWDAIDQEES